MPKFRFLALLLALLLLVGVTSVIAQDDVVTISYWDYWVTQEPALIEAIEVFQEMHPNIRVERTLQGGGNYGQVVQAAFTAGADSTPDVFVVDGNYALYLEQVNNGWLLPLNDIPGFDEWIASVPNTEFVHLEGVDNTINGLTYSSKFFSDNIWIKLFINTRVYEEAGLTEADFPTTLDQMIENSRTIVENTNAYGVGFSGTQTWAAGWWMQMCQMSTQMGNIGPSQFWDWREGRFAAADDPCATAALEGLVQMRDEGLIHPETLALAIDDEAARVLFATHQFAHLIAGDWVIGGWANTNPEFSEFRIVGLPLAGVEEQGGAFTSNPGGRWFGISADTEHPEEAFEWFKFLYSPEFASIWIKYNDEGLYRMDLEEYATTPIRQDIVNLNQKLVPGPSLALTAPETAQVVFTLQGPTLDDIVMGIFTGQLPDINAALLDLQERQQAAFDAGLADAQAAGLEVSVEDYILPDWNPPEPYVFE